MTGKALLIGTTIAAVAFLAGCTEGTDGDGPLSRTLTWALGIANPLADTWNENHKITLIIGVWVNENGELGEPPDNPAWGILYTDDDDSAGYGVLVHYEGYTETEESDAPEITEELDDYSDKDVEDWLDKAIEIMEDHPDPLDAYDYILFIRYEPLLWERDVAYIYFFEEDDQDTDYDYEPWEWKGILQDCHAFVWLDAASDDVLLKSWLDW
ncbi:MAG TPA: hypothetical protein ENN88_02385 [Candidatus Coatesbacteria bacterium]|nr:hypothetical protein [Candidatus Coatesbacteria bacterium]